MPKTPSSLKWLINKRARILNEILKLESSDPEVPLALARVNAASKELKDAKHDLAFKIKVMPKIIEDLKNDLNAIDVAISLHEIQIDPHIISPINTHKSERLLQRGELTRLIYQCLKHAGGMGLYTSQIYGFIVMKNDLRLEGKEKRELHIIVQKRLKTLCSENKIERLHEKATNEHGRWRLPQS